VIRHPLASKNDLFVKNNCLLLDLVHNMVFLLTRKPDEDYNKYYCDGQGRSDQEFERNPLTKKCLKPVNHLNCIHSLLLSNQVRARLET
jgi:hypothetical protein